MKKFFAGFLGGLATVLAIIASIYVINKKHKAMYKEARESVKEAMKYDAKEDERLVEYNNRVEAKVSEIANLETEALIAAFKERFGVKE
jgi:TRAP-type C4-dicarboxylate transport system permease large subunit